MTEVQVTATYRERIMLPPGHVLTVKVEDVSLMDAPSRTMAEVRQPLNGRAPPYAVTLSMPSDKTSTPATAMPHALKSATPPAPCASPPTPTTLC